MRPFQRRTPTLEVGATHRDYTNIKTLKVLNGGELEKSLEPTVWGWLLLANGRISVPGRDRIDGSELRFTQTDSCC